MTRASRPSDWWSISSRSPDEKRVGVQQANDAAPIKVNQWRVAIADIEKRTGLSFGDDVRGADMIAAPGQLTIGEAQRLITTFEDIKL